MDSFHPIMDLRLEELNPSEKSIINEIWEHRTEFVQWPVKALLLWEGCIRIKYHEYPEEIKNDLRSAKIAIDSRSNGPAIMSFLLAGGKRPQRTSNPDQQWHIHHIYDGKFPWEKKEKLFMQQKMESILRSLLASSQFILSQKHFRMNTSILRGCSDTNRFCGSNMTLTRFSAARQTNTGSKYLQQKIAALLTLFTGAR